MFHAGKNSSVSMIFVLCHGPHSLIDHRKDRKIDFPWQNPDEYPDVSGLHQIDTSATFHGGVSISAIWMSSVSFITKN